MIMNLKPGFTLVELLVVIAILSILSTLGVTNFQSARIKSRDLSRKSDLQSIAKSLEAYVNDHRVYPASDLDGKIICQEGGGICDWGGSFTDDNGTIYLSIIPSDPVLGQTYFYTSTGGSYTLFAHLQNEQDPALDASITQTCGTVICNYKISSSNTP